MLLCGSRKANLTTTLMNVQIPEQVLKGAENINLRDLLESPTLAPWLISSLSNGLNVAYNLGSAVSNEDDQFLQFKLNQMLRAVPYPTRQECFRETARMIRERKESRLATSTGRQPTFGN